MCTPTCTARGRPDPEPGTARKVADFLAKKGVEPAAMTRWLAENLQVARFADLCFTHADCVWRGLKDGILLDDLRG